MQAGPARAHSSVEPGRSFQVLVSEQLAHRFVFTGLVIENGFRRQVAKLMRRKLDPCPLPQIRLDEQGNHRLAFGLAVSPHEYPLGASTDHLGEKLIRHGACKIPRRCPS